MVLCRVVFDSSTKRPHELTLEALELDVKADSPTALDGTCFTSCFFNALYLLPSPQKKTFIPACILTHGQTSVWCVDSHGCYKFGNAALGLGPWINLLTSLCFSTFATPVFQDPVVLCAVSKHNKEGMIANITNLSVPRNDARDHAPVHQGVRDASRQDHMSPSPSKKVSDCE